MTNTIILNSIAHLAACVFIGSQYSSQCGKKRLAGLMTFLLALLVAPEFLNLPGPLGVVRIAFQALFMITVSILILKGFERKILIVCFSGAVFSTPGNIKEITKISCSILIARVNIIVVGIKSFKT